MPAFEELQSVVCLLERRLAQLQAGEIPASEFPESEFDESATAQPSRSQTVTSQEAIIGLYLEAMNAARFDLHALSLRRRHA